MRKIKIIHQTLLVLTILIVIYSPLSFAQDGKVLKIIINGDINPASAQYIVDNIKRAERENYECLLIEMDTPGGLLESTKTIVKTILAAQVPVVMYISPSGSGAVSAGVFITMACHIAVMAEGTNIGAAHPVGIGGQQDSSQVMGEKVTNYASSWMRGIAEKHGRNADWAEKAVRESVSINEAEALRINVIDLICPTQDSLLAAIDGRTVKLEGDKTKTLNTRNAVVETSEMNWRHQILNKISNPTIAYILLMLGIYGLFFELSNPGSILPGVAGGIFLILALFALQTLPVNTAGVLLILFAIILFILEVKVTSFGILTIGGIIAMFLGSIMLFDQTPGFPVMVDWRVALTVALATAAFFVFALGMAVKARLTQPKTGLEGLIGETGEALTVIKDQGSVAVHGEIWQAESTEPIKKGEKIVVRAVNGLVMTVEKFKK
ncbi:MAG TPA: nodulation protein NfeD [bacterium]|nr:nodulation protein NfeD [bacterium]HPN43264.1 nodulation protein NfeD [bacterium]